jgi:CRP-like cAMP-binding protein
MPSDLGSSPVSTELDFEDEDEDARGEEPPSMSAEAEEETTVEAPAVEAPESAPPLPPEAQTPTEGGAPEPPDEEAEETDAAPAGEEPSESEEPERAAIESVFLDEVRGFEDLPEEQQAELARDAELQPLSVEEEVGSFGAALVVRGAVGIMPAIADVAASIARPGDVVFTTGSLEDGIVLRVVALEDETLVASWKKETLDAAFAACPWVVDELREVADRFQALAGATLGDLGDRLDDSLRAAVTDRLQVRVLEAGDVIVEKGVAVPGLYVVGAGRLELVDGDEVVDELGPGDFVFPTEVTSAGAAPSSVRTGQGGALVLFASRTDAHELMLSVPPLLEILAG